MSNTYVPMVIAFTQDSLDICSQSIGKKIDLMKTEVMDIQSDLINKLNDVPKK